MREFRLSTLGSVWFVETNKGGWSLGLIVW